MNEFLRDEHAAAIVEAGIVLPLLVLLIFGILDTSIFFWEWNAAGKAAHAGVRLAIVSTPQVGGLTYTQDPTVLGTLCSDAVTGVWTGACCATAGCAKPAAVSTTCTTACNDVITKMSAIFPQLQRAQVTLTYTPNGLGYAGRPGPLRADVTVRIDQPYTPIFLGALSNVRLRASATLPSEDLSGSGAFGD